MLNDPCPFCFLEAPDRVFYQDDVVAVLWDGFAVSPGHALVVPRRHVATWFEANDGERSALLRGIDVAREEVLRRYTDPAPEGFNIGINVGAAAGQTVFHLHVHLIPRYSGDVPDPRGGVRHVIPAKGNYFVDGTGTEAGAEPDVAPDPAIDEELRTGTYGEYEAVAEPEPQVEVAPGHFGGSEAGGPRKTAGPGEPAGPAKPDGPADAAIATAPHVHFHPRYVHPILQRPPLVRGDGDELGRVLREQFDRSTRVDVAVAFTMESGVALVEDRIRALLDRGGSLRFLTGDYLGATDPDALEWLLSLTGNRELKAFEAAGTSFHPKAYIFRGADGTGTAFVGSSNLTRIALTSGVEWNYGLTATTDPDGYRDVAEAFQTLFANERAKPLTQAWIDDYRRRRPELRKYARTAAAAVGGQEPPEPYEPAEPPYDPHEVQREALLALEQSRDEGNEAGLVVLATGIGKTMLSAFDSSRPEYQRVLFVAHRAEILAQARDSFRRLRPGASFGFYSGQQRTSDAEVLFASIQTIGRKNHLNQFARDAFDYIVVDEFHHAAAPSYRRLIDHFRPKFMLGLTATPDRTDGGDLLALCDENLVYECDMREGISRKLLSPYHYFGVPDVVDYAQIPWRSIRFDEEALTTAVATDARAQNALEEWRKRAGKRTLAFCVSQRHAEFMKKHFQAAGIHVAAVHSGPTSDPRGKSLDDLKTGVIRILFAVDMFNEGLDVPEIDTVLMLRPTESKIIWLQQFGRGLRCAADKPFLTVIDYIGNHRSFLVKPRALLGLGPGHAEVREALVRLQTKSFELPPGCEVTYELEAVDILRQLTGGEDTPAAALRAYYSEFVEEHGVRPRAVEAFHDGFNPRSTVDGFGSWLGFVKAMDGLSNDEAAAFEEANSFLVHLEGTQMSKSYKMLVLDAMIAAGQFPGKIGIDELVDGFAAAARRSAQLRRDVEVLDDPVKLRANIRKNPVKAWVDGDGMGGVAYFDFQDGVFGTTSRFETTFPDALCSLVREIVDWRLADYLDRERRKHELSSLAFIGKVSHNAQGEPMVFINRQRDPDIPTGWTEILVDGERYKANFVKVALNVVRTENDGKTNVLPDILRGFFGERAGLPGTRHYVVFEREGSALRMQPLESGPGVEEKT